MEPHAVVPDRSVVLPFLVVALPVFWFLYRAGASSARYLVASAACLAVAVVVAAALPASPRSTVLRAAVAPSDATLVVLSAIITGAVIYVGMDAGGTELPPLIDRVARGAGLVVGVPLLAALWFTYRLGDWFGEPSMLTQSALVALGLGLTGVWLFALATVAGRAVAAAT